MPIYEYQCAGCGQEFTAIRRITDDTLPECPACHTGRVEKKISLSAFHLKGSGWYKTDYAKSGSTGNGKSPKKAEESSSSGDSSSSPSSTSSSSSDNGGASKTPASTSSSEKPSS